MFDFLIRPRQLFHKYKEGQTMFLKTESEDTKIVWWIIINCYIYFFYKSNKLHV